MNSGEPRVSGVLNLRAGERVRVKSREDILATLDEGGMHDRLPFMPEMLQHCGREFTVFKRADKTCDTIEKSGARRMMDAVHLDGSRCDGSAHGGCGARCLMFWKEAWLERTAGGQASAGNQGRNGRSLRRDISPDQREPADVIDHPAIRRRARCR